MSSSVRDRTIRWKGVPFQLRHRSADDCKIRCVKSIGGQWSFTSVRARQGFCQGELRSVLNDFVRLGCPPSQNQIATDIETLQLLSAKPADATIGEIRLDSDESPNLQMLRQRVTALLEI